MKPLLISFQFSLIDIVDEGPRISQRGFTSFSRNPAERKEDGKKMYGRKMKSRIAVPRLHLLTNHFLTKLHWRRSFDSLEICAPNEETKRQ